MAFVRVCDMHDLNEWWVVVEATRTFELDGRRSMPHLNDDSGQTLVELMIATVIGLIVIFAAFLMLQTSMTQGARITSREDASQRGRLAMEQITRELRSQV